MLNTDTIIAELVRVYDEAVAALRSDIARFAADGTLPPAERRASRAWCYPELRIAYSGVETRPDLARAFGRLAHPGTFATTVTRPALFADYLAEQLALLADDYAIEVSVGRSDQEIPFPYVIDASSGLGALSPQDLARHFPATELRMIGDELADGMELPNPEETIPLALFDGLRTDFSLARLAHYTGTPVEDFQRFILFTNYHRYVDEFVDWAGQQMGKDEYVRLSGAGGLLVEEATENARERLSDTAWRRHQMPAYHLVREDKMGITLVNIGVGPSNAKTICDHLAVLRPEAWLMIGHCGGLRDTQRIGDYVLAHAYLRDDHVLDPVLPPEIPIPAIAEVQIALAQAAERVSGDTGANLKKRMRTGTVATTDDRNWELRYTQSARRLSQSRAIGIDMESATIAAQGYRFRVPYGTLLCVSDKPLHGEIKLPGQANRFYEEAIAAHLLIGTTACDLLRAEGERLHSRKLRAFKEPPFR
ncbi:AMP nucleosidase [Novosphingobium sp.]|jgi:AMP nucleosidase|uniref:AMP nucleosidase n=1 Tax=Novosphingobium sp. TaxID=1874826 RepID=UPI0022C836D8|nr:AMP nucleosidase [Novosphingobium sp.]MCZ8017877.1 AMP nucleosidase [Novosphingobium sp.]MCZ8033599.1 AMP nucleosidase [Novosphingobium sp.]MCZ8050955.1 AMP nucleosidase [Novosphingobium sp.]MCZ8059301.1 AMP nucleosidase [Novosphingobium sp.]MCZ8231139.1 AMP nucleosidase [Novosphingobium sp.]